MRVAEYLEFLVVFWLCLPPRACRFQSAAPGPRNTATTVLHMTGGKQKKRRGAGSAAYAMQRRDGAGKLFCHRSSGRGRPESSREGRLVQREQKSMHERKELHDCADALNAERRQLAQERRQLQQVRSSHHTHTQAALLRAQSPRAAADGEPCRCSQSLASTARGGVQ